MSLSVSYASTLTADVTLTDSYINNAKKLVEYNGLNSSGTYNGSSSVAVNQVAIGQQALSSGAATIDLTNLFTVNGKGLSLSGLKLQFIKFRNLQANSNNITISVGASNGYAWAGASSKIVLAPGAEATFFLNNGAGTIGSGAKTLDITGTSAEVLEYCFIA